MKEIKVTSDTNCHSDESISEILDKLLLLKEKTNKPSFLRKTIYIVSAISIVAFVLLICLSIYKNNLSTESILSTLLAFFSIFMSVFFYFKADDTSTRFYDSSYKFMKDISVTLGKIEERFGEKLNSLNDKVSHLDRESKQVSAEIEDKQEDKDRIINELMEKANLTAEERAFYKKELERKDTEIEQLQIYRMRAEREARMLRQKMEGLQETIGEMDSDRLYAYNISPSLIQSIIDFGKIPDNLPSRIKVYLKRAGCIEAEGDIVLDRLYKLRNDACNK